MRIKNFFNISWYFGEGAQEKLISKVKPSQRIIKIVHSKEGHGWSKIEEGELLELINNNSFICEILNSYPKKVYFDIDCDEPDKLELNKVKEIINKYFEKPEMAISGFENDQKKSYHIILSNYVLNNDDDLYKLKHLVKIIYEHECEFFDWKVYTKNRAMKCIQQSKPDKPIQAILQDNKKENHFICSFFTGYEKVIDYNIPEEIPQEEIIINELPKIEPLKLPNNFTNEIIKDNIRLLKMAPINENFNHAYVWRVAMYAWFNGIEFNEFWEWAKVKNDCVHRLNKWKNRHWPYLIKNNKYMTKKTFIQMLTQFYPELSDYENDEDIITNKFLKSFNLEDTKIKKIELKHFKTKDKAVIFNIGMGGGKTTATVNYLKETNKSFIWITPRQALVLNTMQRFNYDNEVINYMDCGKNKLEKQENINKAKKLLLQAESLHYLNDTNKFDVIIIDEIETVLRNWNSQTHERNIRQNFNNFKNLLINTKKIILLDAFTTTITTDFLKSLEINDIKIYGSLYKPKPKECIENNDYEKTIKKIAKDLNENKKVFIFYAKKGASKNCLSIEQLKNRLESNTNDKKFLVYHGDQSDSNKKTLLDVGKYWKDSDCIITTSAITVGVNYEGLDFDKVYLFVSGYCNTSRDVIQSSMRIRHTKEDKIEMFFFDKTIPDKYIYPSYYGIKEDMIYNKLIDNIFIEKRANFMTTFYKFCELTNYNTKNIKRHFIYKSVKFINTLFESKMLVSYNNINEINSDEVKDLEHNKVWKGNASQEDKFKLTKYYFNIKYNDLEKDERAFIWNNKYNEFFNNINNNFFFSINKDNNITNLKMLDLNKIIISDETNKLIKDNYIYNLKNDKHKIIKIIDGTLGNGLINIKKSGKNTFKYFWSEDAEELFRLNDKLTKNQNNNDEYLF